MICLTSPLHEGHAPAFADLRGEEEWFAALDVACARIGGHGAGALVVSLGLDTFEGA